MHSTYLTIVFGVLATLITAQSGIQDLPACARTCVTQFTTGTNIGGCSGTDIKCICSSASFLSDIACCLAGKCDAADQQSATSFAQQFCAISGVTGLPSAVSCASTAVSSSASSTASSSAATVESTGTTTAASVTSSAGTSATSKSTPTSASAASSSSASTSAKPNDGAKNVARVGAGVLGAAMAVLL